MVQGEGFEPPKAEPDDLQSPVFDRFTIPALLKIIAYADAVVIHQQIHWSRLSDSNRRHSVYKTDALTN